MKATRHITQSAPQLKGLTCVIAAAWSVALVALLGGCSDSAWNNPYPARDARANVIYSAFSEQPKHLDPVRSYSSNEYVFLGQIYEPPLQYHFLKRPYTLVPLTAQSMPEVRYFDAEGKRLPDSAPFDDIAISEYLIRIRPGIQYQPHPALARAEGAPVGEGYLYHALKPGDLRGINNLKDFPATGTRELRAEDYVYQIKRLAAPWLHSPIAGLMNKHILDFAELGERLREAAPAPVNGERAFFDLRQVPFAGAEVIDRHSYRIRIKGRYPQFQYWLAMLFFSPMPWEAEAFYAQPGLAERNITLDWYPLGSGAFMLSDNNPNLRMVLDRNPHFHGETYPSEGMPEDREAGLLQDAGQPLPLVDQVIFALEKESIPYWNKFLQGYYDSSGIASDAFDQAIQFGIDGEAELTPGMRAQGIRLATAVDTSIWYLGFNMLDPILGADPGEDSERARLLRRAIAMAVDFGEYISIFANGRGIEAQGMIPPGIFGHHQGRAGLNPYLFDWQDGHAVRKPISEARALLAKAGYPDGRDPKTGRPLTLYYEAMDAGPDGRARLNWMRKQFAKLGIELIVRATDYNRFQEKMREGTGQIFMWGWNADYPDPENLFFLLYGPNAKVKGGENAFNYQNPEFDRLFEQMRVMDDTPERQALIDEMTDILRRDGPVAFGFFPKSYSLYHQWVGNVKPNLMANNTLKYRRLNPELRADKRLEWNSPILWPLGLLALVLVLGALPAWLMARRRERSRAR